MLNEIFGDNTTRIHEALEADIERISAEIGKHKESPETKHLEGKELVKKSLQTVQTGNPVSELIEFSDQFEEAPAEDKIKVEKLLDQAIHEGILKADREARQSGPFVLDAFHDALAEKITPLLKEKGVI
jgi:hypothetical protein